MLEVRGKREPIDRAVNHNYAIVRFKSNYLLQVVHARAFYRSHFSLQEQP